jgi:hypothetical protein
MVALISGDVDNSRGELTFVLTQDVNLDLIVTDAQKPDIISLFTRGSKIVGIPARMDITEIKDGYYSPLGIIEGVLIEKQDGVYIVPFDYVEEVESETVQNAEIVVDEVGKTNDGGKEITLNSLNAKLSKNVVFGFNWKQIILIGSVAYIAAKVAKK